jgi:hypothetical protein
MKTRRACFTFLSLTLTLIAMAFLLSPQTSGQQDAVRQQDIIGQCRVHCRQQYKTCKDAANANKDQCKQTYDACRDSCKDARWQVLNNGTTGGNMTTGNMTTGNMTTNANTTRNMNTNGNMNRNTNVNGNMNRNTNNTNMNTNANRP